MDDRLHAYIAQEAANPPHIDEKMIVATLQMRRKRFSLIMLSLAGGLWALLLYAAAFWVGRKFDSHAATMMLLGLSLSYIGAGCFAGVVVQYEGGCKAD
ncbi:MAG: hypothetical protein LBN04_08695 [Oscillospiraceae bacterium]|jgi:hypothetical protein|nr:hypothetical protein [Oscillospiraceae bacterium]